MNTFTINKIAKEVAIRFHLSEFPEDISADEVIRMIEDCDGSYVELDDIVVWEPFEYWEPSNISDSIWNLAMDIESTITEALQDSSTDTNA